eukprot:2005166-Pyramimonas_sp.AAC.1
MGAGERSGGSSFFGKRHGPSVRAASLGQLGPARPSSRGDAELDHGSQCFQVLEVQRHADQACGRWLVQTIPDGAS